MSAERLRALIARLGSERGQSAAEYLGVVVFVVALIAALHALAPSIGDSIAEKVREQVAAIASPGDGSGPAGGTAPGGTLPAGTAPGGGATAPGAEVPGGAPGGADDAGEEDEPGLLEQGFDALGDGAGALAGGLGDLASGGGDLLSGAGDLLSGGLETAGDVLGGIVDGGGALLGGFVAGDFGGAYDSPWLESLRQVGQFASGVLVFGDVRDAGSAIGEIISSGGREGWGNLGLSVVGIVPVFGDAAKGVKGLDAIVSAFRAGDRARDGSRAADAGRGADAPPARPRTDCSNSFTARTPVLMASGERKAIVEIDVGERVIATDPQTGESGARAVERVIRSEGRKTLVRVRVGGQVLTATDRHPFWVESQGAYRDAADLRPGDVLREPDGERTAVESVRVLEPEPERVHNLTVAGLHTYYAGKAPVLVHNADCPTVPRRPLSSRDEADAGNWRTEASKTRTPSMSPSKQLGENLDRSGTPRPPGTAAHHIVPAELAKFEDARRSQAHLQRLGIKPNQVENGVYLPCRSNCSAEGAWHPEIHTERYYGELYDRLAPTRTREEALEVLEAAREDLLRKEFPY